MVGAASRAALRVRLGSADLQRGATTANPCAEAAAGRPCPANSIDRQWPAFRLKGEARGGRRRGFPFLESVASAPPEPEEGSPMPPKKQPRGSAGESKTGLVVTLVFFILATLGLGVTTYFGFAEQDTLRK